VEREGRVRVDVLNRVENQCVGIMEFKLMKRLGRAVLGRGLVG